MSPRESRSIGCRAQILLTVRGQVAAGADPIRRVVAVDNPTTLFVNAFREALARKGIFVGGLCRRHRRTASAPDLTGAQTWVTDRSSPLFEIVDPLQKWSRNGYAETLLWTLSPPGAPASEAGGLTVLRETLTGLSVDPALYRAFDGSGLSRYDMVSPGGARPAAHHGLERPGPGRAVPQRAAGRGRRRVARRTR